MKKIAGIFDGIRTFMGEVKAELKKCSWPTRSELMDSTVVVIISVVLLGVFVSLSDMLIGGFLNLVIR